MNIYKKENTQGTAWSCHTLDRRFEHHVGTRFARFDEKRIGIISHGWKESLVHLWIKELATGLTAKG